MNGCTRYSATLWLPLAMDMAVVYHTDPFGTKAIGRLSREFRATFLFATPTFLKLYLRRCCKEDLATLDLAVVGAERLDQKVAQAFAEKFGATAVEGYGCTELSPWATVNVPSHRALVPERTGNQLGTVGRVLPGVQVKIVDPDSGDELEIGRTGILLVCGPNVMVGYLNNPEKTAEVIRDDWYDTGDLAKLDEDGFITITGRRSRFSKIGGEMVPHQHIETQIDRVVRKASNSPDTLLVAVTAVPDSRKGERLIVFYTTLGGFTAEEVVQHLSAAAMPNLWLPRAADFIQVEEIPVTSLGKIDLGILQQKATHQPQSR